MMKKPEFLSIINLDDYRIERGIKYDVLIEDLVKKGVFEKRSIEYADDLKKLNSSWNGDKPNSTVDLFASIIYKGDCYFLSKKYIDEAIDEIIKKAKSEVKAYYQQLINFYIEKEEGFILNKEALDFYSEILKNSINTKITLKKRFIFLDYDERNNTFTDRITNILKKELHANGEFNLSYITYHATDDKESWLY